MVYRIERVNHLIRQEISDLLRREIKDPRLRGLVSITEVKTSTDLKYAKVYFSCLCNDDEKKEILSTLIAASGFLQNELAKRIRLRHIPKLDFRWDDSIEKGSRILEMIDRVVKDQEQE
ncbi:MAG: 30S ribosome-binding factor RbfA [Dehalococcoidia bacterium]|nr:MAG: 30S ribosome-binding factor RbfA [Dehalococcoidia bacterium]